MAVNSAPDVVVYVCHNCIPAGASLPRQWIDDGVRVAVHETPCSGKTDGQYLFHALEAGARGLCIVACPKGECHLSQGNYRAEIRIQTLRKLLDEAGLEPQRAELLHSSANESPDRFYETLRDAVRRIGSLAENPLRFRTSAILG